MIHTSNVNDTSSKIDFTSYEKIFISIHVFAYSVDCDLVDECMHMRHHMHCLDVKLLRGNCSGVGRRLPKRAKYFRNCQAFIDL
jgi:hypothetical protein